MSTAKKRTRMGKPIKGKATTKGRASFGFASTTKGYQRGRELARPGQELKAFDQTLAVVQFNIPAGPPNFVTNLNCPINGSELYQRIGRKTYGKSIHIRGWIYNSATSLQDVGRLIIYYDSQPNAAPPAFGDLVRDSSAGGLSTTLSEINLINRQRFQILRDKQFLFPSSTYVGGVQTNLAYPDTSGAFSINEFIKLKGLETIYNSTNGGTVADISSGAIGFVIVSETQANCWSFIYTTRYRYYD